MKTKKYKQNLDDPKQINKGEEGSISKIDTHGDMLFEGRYGNSLRIGSRNINPYIIISNARPTNLGVETTTDGTADNALKFAQSIAIGEQKFRSEEMQKSKSYFIRAFANDMNFSNNPTFTSGSENRIRFDEMIGYPSSFITTVGLYQGSPPKLVAIGKLSGPVEKNYGTEATIKVKLTY